MDDQLYPVSNVINQECLPKDCQLSIGVHENDDSLMPGSQDSDLSDTAWDDVVNKSNLKTTQRATDWGKKKFDEWCSQRGKIIDLVNIEADDLNIVLRKFYAEVKSKDGKVLSPSSLTGI